MTKKARPTSATSRRPANGSPAEARQSVREISTTMLVVRRAVSLEANRLLADHGLTMQSHMVLLRLDGSSPATQNELALDLSMDRATVSRLVARLRTDGLVDVQTDASDRRSNRVSITEAGAKLERRVRPMLDDMMLRVFSQVTPAELAHVREIFQRVASSLATNGFEAPTTSWTRRE